MADYKDEELLFLSNLMHMKRESIYDEENKKYLFPFENVWVNEKKRHNHWLNHQKNRYS